jgi:hypothetical protein
MFPQSSTAKNYTASISDFTRTRSRGLMAWDFQIVWVRNDHGVGMAPLEQPDQTLIYTGRAVSALET